MCGALGKVVQRVFGILINSQNVQKLQTLQKIQNLQNMNSAIYIKYKIKFRDADFVRFFMFLFVVKSSRCSKVVGYVLGYFIQ